MRAHSGEQFSLPEVLKAIAERGFCWTDFRKVFPFGYLDIREGEYVQLVNAVLDSLPSDSERERLLDLLDIQWCVFVEQNWIAQEFGQDKDIFAGECHFATARLQIDTNIRAERKLARKDPRSAMLRLPSDRSLLDLLL